MAAAQRQIARSGDVASVVGPAELARRAAPLAHAEQTVARTNRSLKKSQAVIGGLNSDLGQAATGASSVQSGFAEATSAVRKLASGGAGGTAGVQALQAGLNQAAGGSRQIDAGLAQAASAAGRIASGSETLGAGASSLVSTISSEASAASAAGPKLGLLAASLKADGKAVAALSAQVQTLDQAPAGVSDQLSNALTQLQDMRIGRLDGHYKAAVAAVQSAQSDLSNTPSSTTLTSSIKQESSNIAQAGGTVSALAADASRLSASAVQVQAQIGGLPTRIAQLEQSQRALAAGIQKLASSGTALTNGIGSLSSGTSALTARLSALETGASQVENGLSSEQAQAGKLTAALSSGRQSAANGQNTTPTNPPLLGTLANNPGFFGSGYLVLAALEGSRAARGAGIDFIVNVLRNGQAARMIVVPRSGVRSAATGALRKRLAAITTSLGVQTGATVLLGGPAAQLRDYAAAASRRVPLLVGVLMLATFVLLAVVFRSLLAPLVTVLLNLLSVGAAFGILSLLSRGRHPVIGGPGYVDALSVSAMFAVVFALSLDYQVFLLMRMREGFERTGSTRAGVDYGVARTARVVAGAAAIMAGVFLAFASADVATIRQLGVGLATAIVIDATIVRLVLLPYVLRLGGELTWWLPAPLARALPVLDIGAERRAPNRSPAPEDLPQPPTSLRRVAAVQ
jgi:RND superfamily putative drug exporter